MIPSKAGSSIVIASANFGGGVEAIPTAGATGGARAAQVTAFLADPTGDGRLSALPLVGVLQEMTRLIEPPCDYPVQLAQGLGEAATVYYLPCNSTDAYPWPEKWRQRWDTEDIVRMEEGMAAISARGARLFAPSVSPVEEPHFHSFGGLALDLPIFEFKTESSTRNAWLRHQAGHEAAMDLDQVTLRPAYYMGNRDTDPRAATAHRVVVTDGASGSRETVVVNVHLGTRRDENVGEQTLNSADDVARVVREPTPEATSLRYMHLLIVSEFIRRVYADLRLPVVVVGDFNAVPDAPELSWFLRELGLRPVFTTATCWRCGQTVGGHPQQKTYWTDTSNRALLAESPEQVRAAGGSRPARISAEEFCANPACNAPLFTHKLNFRLIDNILYTAPSMARSLGLRYSLQSGADGKETAGPCGIALEPSFSDHAPVWALLGINEA